MHKTTLKYGLILAALLMNFKTMDYFFFFYKIPLDLYLGIVAFTFLLIGTWMGLHFQMGLPSNNKTITEVPSPEDVSTDEE